MKKQKGNQQQQGQSHNLTKLHKENAKLRKAAATAATLAADTEDSVEDEAEVVEHAALGTRIGLVVFRQW